MKKLFVLLMLIASTVYGDLVFDGVVLDGLTMPQTEPLILAIGDSLTYGTTESTDDTGFKGELYTNLNQKHVFVGTKTPALCAGTDWCTSCGYTGQTTTVIEGKVPECLLSMPTSNTKHKIALILAGTNDIATCNTTGDNDCSGAELQDISDNIIDMLNLIVAHDPLIDIYVCLLIPRDDFVAYNDDVDSLNVLITADVATAITANPTVNIELVDLNTNIIVATMLSADGIHLNDTGYTQMATDLATAINN